MGTNENSICALCSHYIMCNLKSQYSAVLDALEKTEVGLGNGLSININKLDFISKPYVRCKYFNTTHTGGLTTAVKGDAYGF